jgi:uncharacterized membrane protein
MSLRDAADRVLDPGVMSMLVLGAGLVSGYLDLPYTGLIFVLGFAVVVPLTAMLGGSPGDGEDADDETGRETDTDPAGASDDVDESAALETLRERYARGEIDEMEYERRLEDLLATESVGEAREYVERRGTDDRREPPGGERDLERERR